jgi:heterodisulfide reductase subunit B
MEKPMQYTYYPGCSLNGTAREYDVSTRAVMDCLGDQLTDLPDWTCCGASAAEPSSLLLSLALPARNLAIADSTAPDRDILVPCSACYLNLKRVGASVTTDPSLSAKIDTVLMEEGLALKRMVGVRHLLDVLVSDVGTKRIGALVETPLEGLVVAPYYGCQCLRPYPVFDDPERPRSMEPLIAATGAVVHPWSMGARCCGASHMNTKPEIAQKLVGAILSEARGADVIVTVCPMCQMNLEAYQKTISRKENEDLQITVMYLPQLIGLALGLQEVDLGIDLNLAVTRSFRTGRWASRTAAG